jgi:hypothetical protein
MFAFRAEKLRESAGREPEDDCAAGAPAEEEAEDDDAEPSDPLLDADADDVPAADDDVPGEFLPALCAGPVVDAGEKEEAEEVVVEEDDAPAPPGGPPVAARSTGTAAGEKQQRALKSPPERLPVEEAWDAGEEADGEAEARTPVDPPDAERDCGAADSDAPEAGPGEKPGVWEADVDEDVDAVLLGEFVCGVANLVDFPCLSVWWRRAASAAGISPSEDDPVAPGV